MNNGSMPEVVPCRLSFKLAIILTVPVGAVVVAAGRIVGSAHNQREQLADPTAHAEMIALTQAASSLGSWRLVDCVLYVTLEPCHMCA
ncbi:deaminase, partial [uncultured Dokdonia sp.]|uniref:nucleoside deaminase n=1 Tax=uncultured Dokdonia sp. TaxID=575653 RepID=UPI00344D63B7